MAAERIKMVCQSCGSELVTHDAWAEWDVEMQEWVLGAIYDFSFCHVCERETRIEEIQIGSPE